MLDQISLPVAEPIEARGDEPGLITPVIPAFIINLEKDRHRRDAIINQFGQLPQFEPMIVEGVYGRVLPDGICEALVQEKAWAARHKGTLGCFLSHAKAWEEVSRLPDPFAIVLEDDVDVSGLKRLASLTVPPDAEILFLNDRMSPPAQGRIDVPEALPIWRALQRLEALHGGPGGDGYLLTPAGARKLLAACVKDLYFGHVDGRLLQYATTEEDLARLPDGSWIAGVVRRHRHPTLVPALGLLRGYCLSLPLVKHLGMVSIREAEDGSVKATATTKGMPTAPRPIQARPPERPGLPIRYWNFVNNAGDQINPYVFEAVAERTPYYSPNKAAEHVLGIGSIFFMATPESHIWGSGVLDPNADCSQVSPDRVHAVRGKLTWYLLKEKLGLSQTVPLGDPGIFVADIPEIVEYRKTAQIKRRVGVIPHHGLLDHPYIRDITRQPDVNVISPRLGCLDFIKEIIASEIIVSQSLHGLIFAQVFGKPFAWFSHSSDATWLFKFHDWFSTTRDAPQAPAMFGTPLKVLQSLARVAPLDIDKAALREALPDIPPGDRKLGIGFREVRRLSPLSFHIKHDLHTPVTSNYDATIECKKGDEESLRQVLHGHARKYDDSFNVLLVFDPAFHASLTVREMQEYRAVLDELPEYHYLMILPRDLKNPEDRPLAAGGKRAELFERKHDGYDWRGVALARNPYGFSFGARGLALFRDFAR